MPLVGAGSRHDIEDASGGPAEFCIEVTREDLKLSNGSLAEFERRQEFGFRKIGECLISICPIDESVGIEVIDAGEIRGGARIAVAELRGTGNKDAQIQKLSVSDRQVVDESPIERGARLLALGVEGGCLGDDGDGITRRLFQRETDIQRLCDLQDDAALLGRCESDAFGHNLVIAERER